MITVAFIGPIENAEAIAQTIARDVYEAHSLAGIRTTVLSNARGDLWLYCYPDDEPTVLDVCDRTKLPYTISRKEARS